MVAEERKGWRPDPFGLHELRYFSMDGRPTRLVRDGDVLSHDPPPGHALFIDDVGAARVTRRQPAPIPTSEESDPAAGSSGPNDTSNDTPPIEIVETPHAESVATSDPRSRDGWRPDPFGRHEFRYFRGGQPTAYVTDSGSRVREDPPHGPLTGDHVTPPRTALVAPTPRRERRRRSIPLRGIDRLRSALPPIRRQPSKGDAVEPASRAVDAQADADAHADAAADGTPPTSRPPEAHTTTPWRGATSGFSPEMSHSSEN
jgi:hypothetical protein